MSNRVIYAIYNDDDILMDAVKKTRAAHHHIEEVFTPFPVHGLDKAMGLAPTRLAICAFIYGLCGLSLALSLMLVAELPLIALKFKNFGWADNKIRFIFLGLSVVLLATFQFIGIPLVIILYILLSIVDNIFFKKKV